MKFVRIKTFFSITIYLLSILNLYLYTPAKCEPKFSGTFLQSWICRRWDDERWQQEFDCMKEAGISYLVLQCIAERATDGTTVTDYDSSLEVLKGTYCGSPTVETTLSYAQKSGIKVFVGLANYENWWRDAGAGDEYAEICRLSADIASEIYGLYKEKYPDALYGWYFVPEISNEKSYINNIVQIAEGVNMVTSALSKETPGMPMIMSPFFSSYANGVSTCEMLRMWTKFFANAGLRDGDIFAPQDSMGGNAADDKGLAKRWKMLSAAISGADSNIKLWANCELFTDGRDENGMPVKSDVFNGLPQTLDLFCGQLSIASQYVENIITFSYNHYMSPALVNRVFHDTYIDYVNHGFTLEKSAPSAPENIVVSTDESDNTVSWDASRDNLGIAYYSVYRNGKFVANVEAEKDGVPTEYLDKNSSADSTYKVIAVDGAGNRSN